MGKNNAKILRKMNTPRYDLEDADCTFIVVAGGPQLNANFYAFLGQWLSYIFSKDFVIDEVFWMRTRNEVIVGVSKDLDIIPVLGAHKWKHFCTDVEQRTKSDVLVFEYNYPMKGPPGKQQWRDDVPRLTGDERKFHFVDPYPAPSYVERPSNVLDIALPLPAGLRPTPPPPDSQDGPSEPPSSIPKGSKLDPYEQETLAAQSLSSSNVKAEQTPEDVEADRILQESFDEYQRMISQSGLIGPTPEKKEEPPTEEEMRILQQNFDAVQRAAGSITLPEPVKEEAPDAEADRILNELFMAVQQQRAGSQANVKTEGSGTL
ncbi:hypothetical protein OF83DRAFT_1123649 [Amylostereum chailletii]|nr:hypothetical protein OF83DRAFT_1123649 [Amylostereum chailletii]